jgi:hypothetical protein
VQVTPYQTLRREVLTLALTALKEDLFHHLVELMGARCYGHVQENS